MRFKKKSLNSDLKKNLTLISDFKVILDIF